METFKIVRMFYNDRPSRTIKRGLSLAEAQELCRRDDTRGGNTEDGSAWFDGYESE